MTKNQFEKFKKDLDLCKEIFKKIVREMYIDLTLDGGKLFHYIKNKTGLTESFFNQNKNNKYGYEPKIDNIIQIIDAYHEFKEAGK